MSSRRMHVLVIPEQFPREKRDIAGIFVLDYITAIAAHCDVTVLVPGDQHRFHADSSSDAIRYVSCAPLLRGRRDISQRLGRLEVLVRLGRAAPLVQGVDVIHAHGAVFHGVPAVSLGKRLGVPVVLTIHSAMFKLLGRARTRWLAQRTLERVDCVCPVSYDLRRQIEAAGIKPKRCDVTYNPVDTDLFRPSAHRSRPSRNIAFAGRLEEYKGGLRVVRAFGKIAERCPDWTLTIAGDGPELPAIKALVEHEATLRGRVRLLGGYTKTELASLFASSDFFVFPSRRETFGLVIAEAMSSGLPVIGPDRTAPPEFIDFRSGLLVPPDDVSAISQAMERLIDDGGRFDRGAIRQAVVDRFGFASFGSRLFETYRSLAPPPGFVWDATCGT